MRVIVDFAECLTKEEMERLSFSIGSNGTVTFYLPDDAEDLRDKLILMEDIT